MMCKATKIRSIRYEKQNAKIQLLCIFHLNKTPDSLLEHFFIIFYQVNSSSGVLNNILDFL